MKLIPRYYQTEAFEASKQYLKETAEPGILNLATGAGKSIVIAMLAGWLEHHSRRALVITHSSDLVKQNHAKYLMTGNNAGIFSAKLGKKNANYRVTFASVQSVVRSLEKFPPVSLIIIDECHLVSNDSSSAYQKVINHFAAMNHNIRVLGLTATPSRGKFKLVGDHQFFKNEIYRLETAELIEEGYLSPITYGAPTVEEYALSGLKLNRMGKFIQSEVDAITLGNERVTRAICADIVANMEAQNRKVAMVFAASIQHAKECMSYLPGGQAAIVTGETPQGERDGIIQAARACKIKYLVNVGTLTTGVDIPACDCVALLRATESPALLMQIIGRGLRLSPETGKTDCLLLDYGQNVDRHGEAEESIFDDLIEQKSTSDDDAPKTKACPQCAQLVPFSARRCKNTWVNEDFETTKCGYRFKFKECPDCAVENDITARYCWKCKCELVDPNAKLTRVSSRGAIDTAAEIKVKSMLLRPHKKNDQTMLCADYTLDADGRELHVSEYFYDQHEAPFVLHKYKQFLVDIGLQDIEPVDQVLSRSEQEYVGIGAVCVKKNGKYYNVVKRIRGECPVHVTSSNWRGWH